MKVYKYICYLLALFNLADALLTYRLLLNGGVELNPVMSLLFDLHPFVFLSVKVLFSVLVVLLSFLPLYKKLKLFVYLAFFAYLLLMGWHLYILVFL